MEHIADKLITDQTFEADDIRDTFEPSEVIYYSDADKVIDSYERDHGENAEDICSGMEYKAGDWMQAKMAYANALQYCGERADLEEAITATAGAIDDLKGVADDLGCPDSDDIQFSHDCPHGWMAHNRETADEVMIWSNEKGFYNAALIEGELMAVSLKLPCGAYATITWEPGAA